MCKGGSRVASSSPGVITLEVFLGHVMILVAGFIAGGSTAGLLVDGAGGAHEG